MILNAAFEFLRRHKQVSHETETLVMKRISGKVTSSELLEIFEKGITGEFGKVYSLDPQTLIGWVEAANRSKNSSQGYMSQGLLDPDKKYFEFGNDDWMREANKCLTSFLNGVSESQFHPHVYDRMMLDGKIEMNSCVKHLPEEYMEPDVITAKQTVLRSVFLTYKSNGWNQVYFIKGA